MPTITIKKKAEKQDPKLVAANQKHEMKYLARQYHTTQATVREAINTANKNGKPCRSRVKIVKRLKEIIDGRYERL